MAAKKPTKKATKTVKGIEVDLVPSDEIIPSRLYANYVRVSQSPYDCSLEFCDATPILDVKKAIDEGIHKIAVVADIVIPFSLMPGLIKALQTEHEKYKDSIEREKNAGKSSKK